MGDERVPVKLTKALKMLVPGRRVHTFRQSRMGPMLGADWDKKDLRAHMQRHRDAIEMAGELATITGHGLVLTDDYGFLFLATKMEPHP